MGQGNERRAQAQLSEEEKSPMGIRWMETKSGKMVLQENAMIGTNQFGHVVFGWVNVGTVDDAGRSIEADAENKVGAKQGSKANASKARQAAG